MKSLFCAPAIFLMLATSAFATVYVSTPNQWRSRQFAGGIYGDGDHQHMLQRGRLHGDLRG